MPDPSYPTFMGGEGFGHSFEDKLLGGKPRGQA
jgi:hypothetical protein